MIMRKKLNRVFQRIIRLLVFYSFNLWILGTGGLNVWNKSKTIKKINQNNQEEDVNIKDLE